ncbi:MAG: hypothetical protein ACHQ1D_14135, partial [Nitrososphaerales archaeon]
SNIGKLYFFLWLYSILTPNSKSSNFDCRPMSYVLKIMELNEEFTEQIRGLENIKQVTMNAMNMLADTKNRLSQPSYIGQHYVNSKMIDETAQTLESFNKIFSKLI